MPITTLKYHLTKPADFIEEDSVCFKTDEASFSLAKGLLTVELVKPAQTLEEARALIDPIIRSWEFESEIVGEGKRVSFEHGIPDKELQAQSSNLDDSTDETVLVILSRYPPPPSIRVTQTMETMWERLFRAHIEIGESIQNAAYFCLTVLEQKYGNRSLAAKNLNIDAKILSKIGELCSTKGDLCSARKASATSVPLTRREGSWIYFVMRHLILNLGYYEAGNTTPYLSMSDLPQLTS
ncbi:MAG: hypothetical protein CMJ19_23325 [Phycisphaeraceae bacterium]|nr:hypothetical protein [Phycisphaeraceae bacterium]